MRATAAGGPPHDPAPRATAATGLPPDLALRATAAGGAGRIPASSP